ncbi:MAG: FHA domain-containing protein [Kiritimatiellia bacterium]|jgi:predicted component of type VI protein secretion system
MKLHYSNQDGASREFELTEKAITIGRSSDADIMLLDDKVSRRHCSIHFADGGLMIMDLNSKNGTLVNGERIDTARLAPSDVIKVGSYSFTFDQPEGLGTQTALREISDEMSSGKGYATLLKEIVKDSDVPPVKKPEAINAPPKISLGALPVTQDAPPSVPEVGSPDSAAPVSQPAPATVQPAKPAVPPVAKQPLGPTRPKILIRPAAKPVVPVASANPATPPVSPVAAKPAEAPKAGEAPASEETTVNPVTPAPAAAVKPVIRKPTRPVIRLNMNKKT